MNDTAKSIRDDFKVWTKKYLKCEPKSGWACLSLILLVLRAQLAVFDKLEENTNEQIPRKS